MYLVKFWREMEDRTDVKNSDWCLAYTQRTIVIILP